MDRDEINKLIIGAVAPEIASVLKETRSEIAALRKQFDHLQRRVTLLTLGETGRRNRERVREAHTDDDSDY